MTKYLGDVRCWVNSGKHLLALSFSGFDPTETFAAPGGGALDPGFSIYRRTRVGRYDAMS
jgi:hypothetical protein